MFTKMQKFCILAFVIAPALLVFADANGYIDSRLGQLATEIPTKITTEIVTPMASMPVEEQRRLQGEVAQIAEEQKTLGALAETQTQTATTTARAAATMATTVTLASSNAPATLTTTNDVDERVLSTTKPAEIAEVETDGRAKPQQEHVENQQKQAEKNDANMRKRQVLLFVEEHAAAESTATATTISSKINAATLATTTATLTNRGAAVGNAPTKIAELPNGNFESKSRADTLPLDKATTHRGGNPTESATAQLKDKGNEAKTQIIKNAKELRRESLIGQEDIQDRGVEVEKNDKVNEEQDNAERAHGVADKVFQSHLAVQRNSEIAAAEITNDYTETTEINAGPKPAPATNKPETASTDSRISYTESTAKTVEKSGSMEEARTKTQATTSERAVEKNIPAVYEHSLLPTKLAKIITDDYNKDNRRRAAEDKHEKEQAVEQVTTAVFTSATEETSEVTKLKAPKVVKPELNAQEYTKTTTTQQQKYRDKTTTVIADHDNDELVKQKQQEKVLLENKQQREVQRAFEQQRRTEEQQSKPNQLQREQSNENIELMNRWQVQQENNASIAIELNENRSNKSSNSNNSDRGSQNNNNKNSNTNSNNQNSNNNKGYKNIYNALTNSKPDEQSDHVEYTIAIQTTTTTKKATAPIKSTSTPPAALAHIYDLYPMRKEDFNIIIRDSNEKLLRERTIYKPTGHSDVVEQQQVEPIDMLNAMAQNVGHEPTVKTTKDDDELVAEEEAMRKQQSLLPNEVDKMDNIIVQRYDNINNLAATQRNIKRRPNTTTVTTAATSLIGEEREEEKGEAKVTDDMQQQGIRGAERDGNELGMKRDAEQVLQAEEGKREQTVLKETEERRPEQVQREASTQWHASGQADAISDFTGKLLAEQDGVITEIEQKFRLNEFAATVPVTATETTQATATVIQTNAPATSTATTNDNDDVWHASSSKSVSYSVNHKIQRANSKTLKNKNNMSGNNNNNHNNKENVRLTPQHDFIERRVKKSFDFPMHRAASASDTLQMPHVDFANTKFNTGNGAASAQAFSGAVGGATGELGTRGSGAAAMRAALGTHPEFSTTKFYNSKELYNEMMLHNRQRLKAKAKEEDQKETEARTATLNAPNFTQAPKTRSEGAVSAERKDIGTYAASSRFALPQSSKLETSKYGPEVAAAAANKTIMPSTVHMNSQGVHDASAVVRSAVEMRESKEGRVDMKEVRASAEGNGLKATKADKKESEETQQISNKKGRPRAEWQSDFTTMSTVNAPHTDEAFDDGSAGKPTKKYQQNFKRAKLLIKSMLLLPTNVRKLNSTAAATDSTATKTIAAQKSAAAKNASYVRQYSNEAPSQRQAGVPTQNPIAAFSPEKLTPSEVVNIADLPATAKSFEILSLRQNSNIVTPSMATQAAAIGNIDQSTNTAAHIAKTKEQMWDTNTKWVNFDGSGAIMAVKRAKSSVVPTTRMIPVTTMKTTTTHTTNNAKPMSITTRYSSHSSTTTATTPLDDPTTSTPLPLIYPYPQLLHRTNSERLLSQPHDTTAAVVSSTTTTTTTTTIAPSTIPFAYHYQPSATSTITTTTTNHSKSPSKPIVRPRILSRLQEKINSLECEIQNVPSDSHLWRGNETHELLLPIMTSENCPYGGTDCSPLLASWEGEAEIQSGDILIVEINDTLLTLSEHNTTNANPTHNMQVYQVTRSGHEHCDVTEGILLDITPLMVDGRKLVTLYDKDLTEGVNLLIVVSELWGSQCVRLKVTAKTDNCGDNAECSGKGVCYSNNIMEEYECQCCSGFAGPHCEEIDACTPSPCTNNGICVDLSQGHEGNSYQCLCPYGYTGKNCQYESDPCNSAECMNGGSCVGNSTHFRCDCTPGYTGPLCQHSLNECESSPCVHGICVDQEDGFRCFCQPGFAGDLCNFEYNECESNPCQNDGECIDHIGNFECRCTKGYTGTRCQIKVDFCANKPCPDGHRCIDHGNDFSCECPGGNNGVDCNQMPQKQCNENLCKHGGTCWTSGASFYCACRPGYTGNMCEDEFVVETVVSSSEFMVDDTSARNFNDKTFGSSVVLKSPIELHNAYFGAGVLAAAVFIVAVVVAICHCKVNQTYRKFSTRSTTFFPILGFGRRSKSQNKLNKHWLSGKGLGAGGGGGNSAGATGINGGSSLRSSGSTTSLTRGHLPPGGHHSQHNQRQQHQQQQQPLNGGQLHERPFQRHLAMNLENDMYYTVDFSENSQHSPLIQ